MNDNTRKQIERAIKRIQTGRVHKVDRKRRLTILSVAQEAGVSDALIHNRYPDLAHRIRAFGDVATRDKLARTRKTLEATRRELRDTKGSLKQLQIEYSRIADLKKLLTLENEELRRTGKNGRILPLRRPFDDKPTIPESVNDKPGVGGKRRR